MILELVLLFLSWCYGSHERYPDQSVPGHRTQYAAKHTIACTTSSYSRVRVDKEQHVSFAHHFLPIDPAQATRLATYPENHR